MADAIRSDSFCSLSFFFQLAVEHLSFHHPFICSISVLSLPVSRGLAFGYCCQTPDWMECLQCQQKCARWVVWGWGVHTTSNPRQNLSYCLVNVVVKSLVIGVKIILWRFSITQWFDSFSTFEEIFVEKRNCSQLCCCQMKRSEQI